MRRIALLMTVLIGAAGCSQILGLSDVTLRDGAASDGTTPRLIAPLSMSTVTQQSPTFRWALGAGGGAPMVDLCKDRSCTRPLGITFKVASDNLSAVPEAALPPGWVFWRVRVGSGTQTVSSATWQLWVGKSSASNPVDTSNGVILDVNGDGFPDLLVGAYGASAGMGAAYLYLGSAKASATDWNANPTTERIELTDPDGASAAFGFSVASAGDVNGDGYADFLVGAFGTGSNSGAAHLYLGSATPTASSWNGASMSARIDLKNLDGANAIFGASVAGVGDVNGDGYADFLVGASKAGSAGVVHLYLGSAMPSATDWNGGTLTARIDLASPEVFASFGNSVAGTGDVNGDGYGDFLVGADSANSAQGAVHLYLGSAAPSAAGWNQGSNRLDLANVDGSGASFGSAVASAGDVNNDGYADFLISALSASSNSGAAHLYLGSRTPNATDWNASPPQGRIDLTDPDGANALFGSAVASAGDVNGDGYADFLVGAQSASTGAGAAHLYLGTPAPSATVWNGASPSNRISLTNPDGASAVFGSSAAGAGDVNGDGYADLVIGAPDANSMGGASQLYLGSATPGASTWNGTPAPAGRIDLANPAGANALFGTSVAM